MSNNLVQEMLSDTDFDSISEDGRKMLSYLLKKNKRPQIALATVVYLEKQVKQYEAADMFDTHVNSIKNTIDELEEEFDLGSYKRSYLESISNCVDRIKNEIEFKEGHHYSKREAGTGTIFEIRQAGWNKIADTLEDVEVKTNE